MLRVYYFSLIVNRLVAGDLSMSINLYDASVLSYLQTVKAVSKTLKLAQEAAADNILDLESTLDFQLRDNMLPFSFQVISVWHHSLGALKGMKAGLFEPPPKVTDLSWSKLKELLKEAEDYLVEQDPDTINALMGKDMVFRVGQREMPFTTEGFLLSFSLPNVHFHAATTYAILRHLGVTLGKLDYLGDMRFNS